MKISPSKILPRVQDVLRDADVSPLLPICPYKNKSTSPGPSHFLCIRTSSCFSLSQKRSQNWKKQTQHFDIFVQKTEIAPSPVKDFQKPISLPTKQTQMGEATTTASSTTRKLTVEICNAKNLMPKDGQGTASAYAIVDFDGQRRRTKTKFRDLNPQWDEKLEFLVHDSESMPTEILEINLYNDKKTGKRSTFLGKVKIPGSTFTKSGEESLVYYPLEKRSVFSQIKGELGLKVHYVDEDATSPPPAPPPAVEDGEKKAEEEKLKAKEEEEEKKKEDKVEEKKEEEQPKEEAKVEEEKPKPPSPPVDDNNKPKSEEPPPPVAAEVENPPLAHNDNSKQVEKPAEATKTSAITINDIELRSLASD